MRHNDFHSRRYQNYSLRNCEVICTVVLMGTYGLIVTIAALLGVSFATDPALQTLELLAICVMAFIYTYVAHWLKRRDRHLIVAYMVVSFYLALAAGIVCVWGINLPIGTLLLGLVIVLAGILLTARHALIVAALSSILVLAVQSAFLLGWYTPNLSWSGNDPALADAAAYSAIFGMLALISWLYNIEMERSLALSKQAEASLRQQKANLEKRVEKRTEQLRQAQLEEMRQMYRFTEIGQLGATLLHDLANHLAALTLEIEGVKGKQQLKNMAHARKIIAYLDDVVDNTRARLYGSTREHAFDLAKKVNETVELLQHKAAKMGVHISWRPPDNPCRIVGDSACLSQVMTILICNAIEAYGKPAKRTRQRNVEITLDCQAMHAALRVRDRGRGIPQNQRRRLFQPFHSTKKSGLGLGLYIAKQSIEMHFAGTLIISPTRDYTEFTIKIPIRDEKK